MFAEKSKFEQIKERRYHDQIVARRRRNIIIVAAVAAAVIALYLIGAFYFRSHFYPRTVINGINCSWKDVSSCDEMMKHGADDYVLTIYEQDGSEEEITGEEISLELLPEEELTALLEEQNGYGFIAHFFRPTDTSFDIPITYNELQLQVAMNGLNGLNADYVIYPVAPELSDFVEGEGYSVTEAVYGNVIDRDALFENLNLAVSQMVPTLHLTENGCYEGADFKNEIERLDTIRDMLNYYVTNTITYDFGPDTEVITGSMINDWLVIEEGSSDEGDVRTLTVQELADDTSGSIDLDRVSIHVDKDRLSEFVYNLAYDHNTKYLYHPLTTHSGEEITVTGGNYGWYLDQYATLEKLVEYLDAGESYTGEAEFVQRAAQFGEKDYGDTYLEVSLSQQHFWYYRDGVLTLESDLVSGNPSTGHETPKGCYQIAYKARDQVLVGEDYSSPVSYWMPFYAGIGFHDASWRSSFGGTIYQYNGSHGCLNLPSSVAQELYGYIEGGEAVLIY